MDEAEKMIKACANVLTDSILELLYFDSHSWGTRPCQTCKAITGLLGKPFGCDRYRGEHNKNES